MVEVMVGDTNTVEYEIGNVKARFTAITVGRASSTFVPSKAWCPAPASSGRRSRTPAG
ncbi:MAG TPA: hypothetical protein VF657_21920 [Actinoplanes sp.]